MANPFALAAALSRTVTIACPHCGFKKQVDRKPKSRPTHHRVCGRCKKQFPDPVAAKLHKRR